MSGQPRSVLSADEVTELKVLEDELRGLRARWRQLAARLERARKSSVRALVRDRLLCVLQDSLTPALRDLRSIEAEARAAQEKDA